MKYLFALLLLIHASHAYILLTANLDDVQALAKELANSPITEQLKKIWRRTSKQLHQAVARKEEPAPPGRHRHQASDLLKKRSEASHESATTEANQRRSVDQVNKVLPATAVDHQAVDHIISLGKNASYYLNSMKQIILDHKESEGTPSPLGENPPTPGENVATQ